jgi:hypothetical protein
MGLYFLLDSMKNIRFQQQFMLNLGFICRMPLFLLAFISLFLFCSLTYVRNWIKRTKARSDPFSGIHLLQPGLRSEHHCRTRRQVWKKRPQRALPPPLSRFWVYHYLHERHKGLVTAINAVFKAMQESGELEALREQAAQQLF